MMKTLSAVWFLIVLTTVEALGQWIPAGTPQLPQPPAQGYPAGYAAPAGPEDLSARLARLETENQRMQIELQAMRSQRPYPATAAAEPPGWAIAPPIAPPPASDVMPVIAEAPLAVPQGLGRPEVDSEIKRLMWTKGSFKIIPYGILWANSVYSTERTNPGSFTLWVESETRQGEGEFIVDARSSRLGVDVIGPQLALFGCSETGGRVEVDFQGVPNVTENRGGIQLRHAYVETKNAEYRLLAGQTFDVISPLTPNMLMFSIGWNGGNIGFRRAQFRAERFVAFSDTMLLTLQSSINQNIFSDSITGVTGVSTALVRGEPSNWPILEGRMAATFGQRAGPDALPITLGISGHVGEQEFDVWNGSTLLLNDRRRKTWSVNADLRVPVTQKFGLQGEFFMGEDLGAFMGGIGQGIDAVTLNEIHSAGGWGELWYYWTPRLHSHVGYGVDNPADSELRTTGDRRYNQFLFSNLIFDVTKQFQAGLEVSSWKTLFVGLEPGEAVRTEFAVKYAF